MLIVAADLHLDAASSLGRLPDQKSSWVRLCTAAAEHGATVLWGGDSHHHRKPSPAAIAAWQSGLRILREGDCELVGIPGNHCVTSDDLPSTIEVASAGFACHILRTPGVVETEDGVVGFLPWAPPKADAKRTSEALMILAEDLAAQGARILIAHHALSGGSLPNGLSVLELAEPILDSHRLAELFEITLSGHIHKRQETVEEPLVGHIGCLARGNFGEAECWTGGWQIVPEALPTRLAPVLRPLIALPFDVDDRAFVTVEADVTEAGHYAVDQILDQILDADVGGAIVRVRYQQRADQQIDQTVILAALAEYGAHRVDRIEPVVERVQSTRSAGVTEASDPRESFDTWLAAQDTVASDETIERVREEAHTRIGAA